MKAADAKGGAGPAWSAPDLQRLHATTEIQVASRRPDGTLRPWVTIWAVTAGGSLFVRSAYGAGNPWYTRALASGTGRVKAGSLERDVRFVDGAGADHAAIDAAYHAKYDRYGPKIVGSVVGPKAAQVTLNVRPALPD